ncbi:hypothetical protein [Nocardia suismassiliense]|uniref:hypothetical protein n=1 Tax=Nocardia suismassiliense TaxID=2077092 RepID=UPI000D1DCB47|nr:hypothetical protein [Nocardia suismassiliense]
MTDDSPPQRISHTDRLQTYSLELPSSTAADFELAEQLRAGIERRERTPAEAQLDNYILTIRAMATVSLSEAEWVRRMHSAGIPIVAQWCEDDDVVTGYGIGIRALQQDGTTDSRPAILLDGHLPWDLRLTALREHWDDCDHARERARAQWLHMPASGEWDRERVAFTDPALWKRASGDAAVFNEYLRTLAHRNRGEWARAASRVAGVLALWARRTEGPAPAVMAAVATQLGRSTQITTHGMRRPIGENGFPAADLSLTATVLTQLHTGYQDPPDESLRLLQELLISIKLIITAHRCRGEIHHVSRLTDACIPLHSVCRALHVRVQHNPPSARGPQGE